MTDTAIAATTTGPELSGRSIVIGLFVAIIIGSAYPYCVLKLGFGPNLSVVSAFLGFMTLVPLVALLNSMGVKLVGLEIQEPSLERSSDLSSSSLNGGSSRTTARG